MEEEQKTMHSITGTDSVEKHVDTLRKEYGKDPVDILTEMSQLFYMGSEAGENKRLYLADFFYEVVSCLSNTTSSDIGVKSKQLGRRLCEYFGLLKGSLPGPVVDNFIRSPFASFFYIEPFDQDGFRIPLQNRSTAGARIALIRCIIRRVDPFSDGRPIAQVFAGICTPKSPWIDFSRIIGRPSGAEPTNPKLSTPTGSSVDRGEYHALKAFTEVSKFTGLPGTSSANPTQGPIGKPLDLPIYEKIYRTKTDGKCKWIHNGRQMRPQVCGHHEVRYLSSFEEASCTKCNVRFDFI